MSNSDLTTRHHDHPTVGNDTAIGVWPVIRRLICAVGESRNRAREARVLAEMSDHLLRDIGLARTSIGGVVRRVRV